MEDNSNNKRTMIVGIDFATSTTVVRYRMKDSMEVHSVEDENKGVISTVILRNKDNGQLLYGNVADNMLNEPMTVLDYEQILNFKMDLLDSAKRKQTKEYIVDFLRYVHGLFEDQTIVYHADDYEVNISYPAQWEPEVVRLMKQAVAEAGFKGRIRGIKEPRAAANDVLNRYGKELMDKGYIVVGKPLNMMVLDMGAGTSDISIFKLIIDADGNTTFHDFMSYPSIGDTVHCGGREIDDLLAEYLRKYIDSKVADFRGYDSITLHNVKKWKEEIVSRYLKSGNTIRIMNYLMSALSSCGKYDVIKEFSLTKDDFEKVTSKHWEKLYGLVASALEHYEKEYGVGAPDIDFVHLTGGHSSWYLVPKLFNGEGICGGRIGKKDMEGTVNFAKLFADSWRLSIFRDTLPQESVARGLCFDDGKVNVEECYANDIWVKVSFNGREGQLQKIVSKGDKLPCKSRINKEVVINKNLIWGNNKFSVDIDIYVGEGSIENAVHTHKHFLYNDNSIIGTIIMFLILNIVTFVMNADRYLDLQLDLNVTNEGLLDISGKFSVDEKEFPFTQDDLETVC